MLQEIALQAARHFGIVGECNIQYALNPENGDYRVIEMNARLSRSSLSPPKQPDILLAFVAAKLALGLALAEIKNAVTKKTVAFFEPALDYVVVKIPRWDIHKLRSADRRIGTEMKSVGEVMAIGRSFPEALQKAVRMLNIGASGLTDYPHPIEDPKKEIAHATDRRLFALYQFFKKEAPSKKRINSLKSTLGFWTIFMRIATFEARTEEIALDARLLKEAKQLGFSDKTIAKIKKSDEQKMRVNCASKHGIVPYRQADRHFGGRIRREDQLSLSDLSWKRSRCRAFAKAAGHRLGIRPLLHRLIR